MTKSPRSKKPMRPDLVAKFPLVKEAIERQLGGPADRWEMMTGEQDRGGYFLLGHHGSVVAGKWMPL